MWYVTLPAAVYTYLHKRVHCIATVTQYVKHANTLDADYSWAKCILSICIFFITIIYIKTNILR